VRVVIDWDGTATVADTMDLVVREFGDASLVDRFSDSFIDDSGPLPVTLEHVVTSELATIRTPINEVVPWLLEQVELRDGLTELVERYHPLVLSSNARELIEPVLDHFGLEVELIANELRSADGTGWQIAFEGATCSACGEVCKRQHLPPGEVVYIGNGYSDRCPALAADRIFARCGLARYLEKHEVPYEPFGDFHQIVAALERPS
jgi:2-hydroxy-3-keto-5-methylthiopentenyl-1-phosphate phosphatase